MKKLKSYILKQLTSFDAKLIKKTQTKKGYRLFVLENKDPIRPAQIELEVWSMPVEDFGKFMKMIAYPLGIESVF